MKGGMNRNGEGRERVVGSTSERRVTGGARRGRWRRRVEGGEGRNDEGM